jgi:hypothetical protein
MSWAIYKKITPIASSPVLYSTTPKEINRFVLGLVPPISVLDRARAKELYTLIWLLTPGSNMMHTRSPYKSNTILTSSLEILHGFQISIFRVHQRPRLHPLHPSSQPPSHYELLNLKAFPPQPLQYSDLATPTNKSHVQILKFHLRNMRTKSPNLLRVWEEKKRC